MIHHFVGSVAAWIVSVVSFLGYPGIIFLMIIESACIPLPSEITMPFSGYLVSTGRFTLWGATLCGVAGNLLGSILIYALVMRRGRLFVERYGKYVLISPHHMETADRFFDKYGKSSVFFGRFLPVVRTFISLPAGIMGVPFGSFCALTFLGSLPWCYALTYFGMVMGNNWGAIEPYFHHADAPIVLILAAGIAYWVLKNRN